MLLSTNPDRRIQRIQVLAESLRSAKHLQEFTASRMACGRRTSLASLISALASLPNLSLLNPQVWKNVQPLVLPSLSLNSMLQLGQSESVEQLHLEGFQIQGSDIDAFRRGLETNTNLSTVRLLTVNCWIHHLTLDTPQSEWRALARTMSEQYTLTEFDVSLVEGKRIQSCNDAVLGRIQWICRLNAALRGRAMGGTISGDELLDLLALANSDLDMVSNILSKNPSLFKNPKPFS
jgi:hypothetical protein